MKEPRGAICDCCGDEIFNEEMYESPELRGAWLCYDCACEKEYDFDECDVMTGYEVERMEAEYWDNLWKYRD